MADLDDYGPFDAGIGANRTEDFWRDFFRHLTGSAVIDGVTNELAVSERGAGANLSVDVATGECYVRGHWGESTSIKNLPIATADATNPRIDRVVARLDVATNKITLEVLEGTPAGSPSAPGLTQTSATWEIPLAQVSVPALDTTISNAQITNERGFIGIGGYRFPTTTARDLYLTAPSEGDQCWVLGTYDLLYEYNGSAWAVLLARGAGSPESNVTAGIGAIYQRTDGTTGTSLYVKESGTGNTGWVAHGAGGGAVAVIAEAVLGGASATIDFTSIPATYDHLMIVMAARGDNGATGQRVNMRFNNDSGSNYSWQEIQATAASLSASETAGTTSISIGAMNTAAAVTQPGTFEVTIPGYAGSTFKKGAHSKNLNVANDSTAAGRTINIDFGVWFAAPAAINRITLIPAAGNFAAGTVCTLYGMNGA